MRKNKFYFPIVAVFVALLLGISAFALSETVQKELTYRDIQISIDGETFIPLDPNGNVVEPFIIDGTTYLPVRATAEALGLDVGWDNETSTVTLTDPEAGIDVYITRTGSKYHHDGTCNGGTYWPVPYETATGMGLTPCDKCVQ